MHRKWLILILLAATVNAEPTTRPTLDALRPHYHGPLVMVPTRTRESVPDQATGHYVFAAPVPYYYVGYGYGFGGCYGWGGCFYP